MTIEAPDAIAKPDLDARIKAFVAEANAKYEAMTPLERAIADLKQKRSGMIGLSKMSTPRDVIEAQIDRLPEFVILAEVERLRAALVEKDAALAKVREDAERWRALVASPYMSLHGWAGFDRNGVPNDPTGYMHFGISIWSQHHPADEVESVTRLAAKLLTAYADKLRTLSPPHSNTGGVT